MLVAKRAQNDSRVVAAEEERNDGPWVCPSCSAQVALKKGSIKIHHFAHYPPVSCEYGVGESEEHRRCKTAIFEAIRSETNTSMWELERDLGSVRPDVSGYIGHTPVAIEVQVSSLSLERIAHRTREYADKGISVLWIALRHNRLLNGRFSPSVWEKWLHALYFGRVYYWETGCGVVPVHFGKYMLHVKEREWRDASGEEQSAGGYYRASKRFRESNFSSPIPITSMVTKVRDSWSGGGYNIPPSRLWIDQLPQWW